ncbi:hypothetical protein GCM10011352_43000 [Marinobacterium zhoushanense]|uniref:Glycine zipper 2TM domain-containing protein n=1 Tax=Marinobacterium zhoushanense TaxID=1679163 RepID=A0ABQ1KZI2_9GAMM|nr:glycine zipper 2TM domain-containing protein [Marinobacterium zhoushanense]GGC11955.1 hypothetical protein GCM10011352_43000 [Marinobacterium zhoushanense]
MNAKLLAAGLALLSVLGSSQVVQASPFEHQQRPILELSHYKHHDGYYKYDRHQRLARVLEVEPIWPKRDRDCRIDRHRHERSDWGDRSDRGDRDRARIVGALAGGTVGNLIGREHDNALVGTVAGAVIGSVGADIIVSHDWDRHRGEECVRGHKLKYHQQPVAYWVRYIYRGQVYTTRTRHHPGRYIEIDKHYGRRG